MSSLAAIISVVPAAKPGIYFSPIESSLACPGEVLGCFRSVTFARFKT
jgi:hypothetical protein